MLHAPCRASILGPDWSLDCDFVRLTDQGAWGKCLKSLMIQLGPSFCSQLSVTGKHIDRSQLYIAYVA